MIVVVPMAGRGSRYAIEGYETPKPLIEIIGKPMIIWALESLKGIEYEKIVFIVLNEHEEKYQIRKLLQTYKIAEFEVVLIDEVTEGQLCTVLKAKEYFKPNDDLLIIASDSLIKSNIGNEIKNKSTDTKGIISVVDLPGERWSFAKTNKQGNVIEVAEKVRISNHASTGIYYFSNAIEFMQTSENIIMNQEKTKGEYYVIPVYQKMIFQKEIVKISIADEMWDMGTPDAKAIFEKNYLNNGK